VDIDDLYALLPDFRCLEGCTECCTHFGVPSRTRAEDERIREFLRRQGRDILPARGTTCPYVSSEGCTIHPVRPLVCRLYGTSPNYRCVRGVAPSRYLHPDEEAEIFELYRAYFF